MTTRLPYYFYDLEATLPNGKPRWFDEFAGDSEDSKIIQIDRASRWRRKSKMLRNIAYAKWQASFFHTAEDGSYHPIIKPKTMLWQAIRVLSFKHKESGSRDWWENYQDAVFRVFLNPETCYDPKSNQHVQWYILSPEDGYLVNRHEKEKFGSLAPRRYNGDEKYLSADKDLRVLRAIPVECCHHLRHETTAGVLPTGL